MKRILNISFQLMAIVAMASCGKKGSNGVSSLYGRDVALDERVYICTGRYAKAYHAFQNCRGLDNCQADVIEVSLEDALNNRRHACELCW